MLEIVYGNYNSLYLHFLYKGIYNFEAVSLMESRIHKELMCASVLRNYMKSTLRRNLFGLKKKKEQNQNCTNAQPKADN